MKVIVGEHKCTIDKTPVNELEVNVTKVEFEFDEKIPANYAKKAFFTQGNISKEVLLESNECDIPNEVLYQKGQVRLGVIAYEVQNGELIERFNPTPTYFPVWEGSLTEADNTEPITPTDKEQIESAIANIQAEQVTQNQNISQNTSDIGSLREGKQDKLISGQNIKTINNESLLGEGNLEVITDLSDYYTKGQTDDLLDDKADRSEIPDVSEFITKDVDNLTNYTKTNDMNTAINTAVGNERTSRESSDVALQNQIDAITASSDVVDVVSTYQDLLNYSTASLTEDDIIKVMQDESHSNAISYFRWQLSTWNYIGSEGPFYTKGETDTLLNNKANVSDLPDLTDYVKNTDYATSSKGGVIRISSTYSTNVSSGGNLVGMAKNYEDYTNGNNNMFISKSTLENVITGKQLVNQTTLEDSQAEQDTTIEGLQAELERYKLLENALPHTENETASDYVTLENTANSPMEVSLTPQTSQETTSGKNLLNNTLLTTETTKNGITFTPHFTNGMLDYINLNGTATANTYVNLLNYNFGETSFNSNTGGSSVYTASIGNTSISSNAVFIAYDTNNNYIYLFVKNGATINNAKIYPMIRLATITDDTYEPYTNGPAPNPDFPMEIHRTTGENQVKVVGKNLWGGFTAFSTSAGGVDFTNNADGSVTASGTATSNTSSVPSITVAINNNWFVTLPSGNYTASAGTLPSGVLLQLFNAKNGASLGNTQGQFTLTEKTQVYARIRVASGTTIDATFNIQLEQGSTATSYTPYESTTYSISLGTKEMFNINGVYDGFVYDEATDKFYINRKIGKVVFDGSEAWSLDTSNKLAGILVSDMIKIQNVLEVGNGLSNYYKIGSLSSARLNTNEFAFFYNGINGVWLNCQSMTISDFKSWLSTHNTIVVYQLATSTLEEITDTTLISQLRAIKNALSMQGTTHIISTASGSNLPFLIKARAVQNISNS